MTDLLLVGASGLAREALNVVRASLEFRVIGILDDNEGRYGTTIDGVGVLGALSLVHEHPSASLVICVGRGTHRALIDERLRRIGVTDKRYARVIHSAVDVPRDCHVGAGSIVLAGVVLTSGVILGRHVVVMPNATLTHGNRVESFATLCAGVTLGGGVRVAEEAYLGMNSAVRERVRIGRRATLGMGAALLHDLPAGETWVGVPAARALAPVVQSKRLTEAESRSR
ncbi:MAG: acetyltransferase [Subtercola sp.]|nr:acetyltransferase [Subtercola sp.]